MKKTYVAPNVEKIAFKYREQVVAFSAIDGGTTTCHYHHFWEGETGPEPSPCHKNCYWHSYGGPGQ